MATVRHTYDRKCRLRPVSVTLEQDGTPGIRAQFFYSSLMPIDEPRSTGAQSSGSDRKYNKKKLRPFGPGDNNSLERTWLSLKSDDCRSEHEKLRETRGRHELTKESEERRQTLIRRIAAKHLSCYKGPYSAKDEAASANDNRGDNLEAPARGENEGLHQDVLMALQQNFCALARQLHQQLSMESILHDVNETIGHMKGVCETDKGQVFGDCVSPQPAAPNCPPGPISNYSFEGTKVLENEEEGARNSELRSPGRQSRVETSQLSEVHPVRTRQAGGATQNYPESRNSESTQAYDVSSGISASPLPCSLCQDQPRELSQAPIDSERLASSQREAKSFARERQPYGIPEIEISSTNSDLVVGLSRLHQVSLSALQMKPIYWSPVNDIAAVMRATWFYRDTMMPVAPTVANLLEAGYRDLQPWTETWGDEIRCAIAVGPLGEEKVSHSLWPQDAKYASVPNTVLSEPRFSTHPSCAALCFGGEAAAEGIVSEQDPNQDRNPRAFAKYHVIYQDDVRAFLLKPNLQPSAYYGRRPVLKIAKGLTVGIPVVRGFDWHAWNRVRGGKLEADQSSDTTEADSHFPEQPCPACRSDEDEGRITDLILVAHGIGQKFAERVESFHFTHAINSFRKAVDLEMANPAVRNVLRRDHTGLMILPLNWRMGLSFEDGGPSADLAPEGDSREGFGLKDIEPSTIPAVRSMISDVMFDIPFYMSHHKNKMIKALVGEANRVYRLWCRNNPDFAEKGRVHMIAHSLGSVMAVDVLSRQPTAVPRLNVGPPVPSTAHFEFNTTNLFLLGSPAGFFLLLERGALTPRHGRDKAGADLRDSRDRSITGTAGTFGCLAVDNIYNILAKEDPIAYLLNGAVDPGYAASLKAAYVPTTSTSIFKSLGNAVRHVVPGMAPPADPFAAAAERPPPVRLPSQLEMEVHDFSREELAEKRAFLLNDNGQIDWFLRSGSGPLEIQYLNMLSAHTSYWINQDFIRLVCFEIGRAPGRNQSLPAMRAVKISKRFSTEK